MNSYDRKFIASRKSYSVDEQEAYASAKDSSPGVIGIIMLLNLTAYRTSNIYAHNIHACDLLEILKLVNSDGDCLTPAALRAVIWVGL